MKILSIDVGIKNLALCLFEKLNESEQYIISKQDIINLSKEESYNCTFIDKNNMCNKPAKYKKYNKCYCLKHSKKQEYKIPKKENNASVINKQKIAKLHDIAKLYDIHCDAKIKKIDFQKILKIKKKKT